MESGITKFGIRDFFSAFRTDTIHDNERANISDLKPTDWETVSKEVKEELTISSQKRIEKIEKIIGTIKAKIKDTLARSQEDNKNYGVKRTAEVQKKVIENEEEIVH